MTTCTTTDCGRPTETYLCAQCVTDLDAWIQKANEYAPELDVTIAKQDVLRKAGNTGGGGNKAGSAAPVNLDAIQLQQNLYSVGSRTAAVYAQDQFAAGIAWTIQDWVTKAERLISGPEADHTVDQLAARRRLAIEVPEALHTKPLIEWLKVTHGIDMKESLLRKWAERGTITRNNHEGRPTYDPTAVLIQARKNKVA